MCTHIEPTDPNHPADGPNSVPRTAEEGVLQGDRLHQVTTATTGTETIGHATAAAIGLSIQDRQLAIVAPTGAQAAIDRTNSHRMGIERKVFTLLALLHVSDEEQRTIQRGLEALYDCAPKLHTQESHACIVAEVERICLRAAQIMDQGGADQRVYSFLRSGIARTTALVSSPIIQGHCRVFDAHTLAQCLLHPSTSTEDAANIRRIEEYIRTHFPPTCPPQWIYEMNKIILAGIIGLNGAAESREMSAAGLQEPLPADSLTQHTPQEVLKQLQAFCEEHAAPAWVDKPAQPVTRRSGTAPATRTRFTNVTTIRTHTPPDSALEHFIAQQQATILALVVDPATGGHTITEPVVQTCEQAFQGIKTAILGLITHEGNDSQTICQAYQTALQAYLSAPHRKDPLSFITQYAATLHNQWIAAEKSALPSAQLHGLIISPSTLPGIAKIGGKGRKMILGVQELATKMVGTTRGNFFLKKLHLAGGSHTEKHQNAKRKAADKQQAVSRIKKLAATLKNPQHCFTSEGTALLEEIYQLVQNLSLLFGPYLYTAQQNVPFAEEKRVVLAMQVLAKKIHTLGARFPLQEKKDNLQFLIEVFCLEKEITQYKAICQKNTLFFSTHTTPPDREIQEQIAELANKIKLLHSLQGGQVFLDHMVWSLRDSARSLRQYIVYHQVYLLYAAADMWVLSEIEALLIRIQQTPDLVLRGDIPFLQEICSFSHRMETYSDRSVEADQEERVENNLGIYKPYVQSMLAQLASTDKTTGID